MLGEALSLAEIGRRVGRDEATVGYWVKKHGLEATNRGKQAARGGIAREALEPLVEAGMSIAEIAEAAGCSKRCRSEAVARRRRKVKAILVHEAGGSCCICGYDRNMRALHFHHLEPSLKRHEMNAKGVAMALEKLRAEAQKCVLLCSNCHAEVEDGMAFVPADALDRPAMRGSAVRHDPG
jgi:hypothetical protein